MKKILIPVVLALGFVLMAAGSLVRISSGVPPGAALSAQEKSLLAQAIAHPFPDGGYNVVSPASSAELLLGNDAAATEANKQYLISAFGDKGHAVSGLVERLFQRNASPAPLPLESAPAQGYLIDDGSYAAYFRPDGGGWEKLRADHPRAHDMLSLSLPVYDESAGLFMVYVHGAAIGKVILYKYENGALRQLDFVPLWVKVRKPAPPEI